MIRARFFVEDDDYRPVIWPIKHPYWCTGTNAEGGSILVAYADTVEDVYQLWPDAQGVEVMETTDKYNFTSRFPRPDWMGND
jgi:hypothetical protein